MTAHVQQIRQQQRELLAELDKQRVDHAQRALQLVADPTDPDLIEAVEASVARIEALQKRLALFEAAISGAQVRDTQDARAERRAEAVGARAQLGTLTGQRQAVAGAIDAAVATLGDLLAQFDDLSTQISRAAHCVTKACTTRDDRYRLTKLQRSVEMAHARIAHTFGAALTDARVGDALAEGNPDPLRSYKRSQGDKKQSVAEGVASRQDKLLAHLDDVLENSK